MRSAILTSIVFTGVGLAAGCGSEPRLSAEETTSRIQAACADFGALREDGVHPVAGDTFSADTLDMLRVVDSAPYDLLDDIRGPKDGEAELLELRSAIQDLSVNLHALRTDIELRQLDEAEAHLAEGAEVTARVDALAESTGLTNCTSDTWVGDWYVQAKAAYDELVESTKPTGDFVTDVETLCTRLNEDISSAPLPFGSIETQQWALAVNNALDLFSRDLESFDIPEGKERGVDELMTIIDQLKSDLSGVVSGIAGSSQAALDASIEAAQTGIGDFVDALHELGAADC